MAFFTNELMQFLDNIFSTIYLTPEGANKIYISIFGGIIYLKWTLLTALAG
tara:strand:- start:1441 stop:1593 length:153 start_codon:yes stop_codon:yes gene_type:complete